MPCLGRGSWTATLRQKLGGFLMVLLVNDLGVGFQDLESSQILAQKN